MTGIQYIQSVEHKPVGLFRRDFPANARHRTAQRALHQDPEVQSVAVARRAVPPEASGPSDAHCGSHGNIFLAFREASALHSDATA